MKPVVLLVITGALYAAAGPELLKLARNPNDPAFSSALQSTFKESELKTGAAVSQGGNYLVAIRSSSEPEVAMDWQPVGTMTRAGQNDLWFLTGTMRRGTSHHFVFTANGKKIGDKNDVPAYLPDSYAQAGVPQGKLSEKMIHTSKLYEGMQSDWWIYVPAQYDAAKPAALMVWHDGQGLANRSADANALNVFDNLLAQGKIPVIIQVFIAPGKIGDKAMRSIEYDTVSDRYPRFLRDEILPLVYAKYNVRRDSYSRAIAGNSSGGISSFNAAWWQPDQFSRVLMRIASFSNLQQNHPGEFDGGNTYPYRVRKEEKRNMRVWSSDGAEDLENVPGGWLENNINMINSLKLREYDFHFAFGVGSHNGAQGNAELPESLAWLWRGYDPIKTQETYTMDPAEKEKPFYRVRMLNRE